MKDFTFPIFKKMNRESAIYFSGRIIKMFKNYMTSDKCQWVFTDWTNDEVNKFIDKFVENTYQYDKYKWDEVWSLTSNESLLNYDKDRWDEDWSLTSNDSLPNCDQLDEDSYNLEMSLICNTKLIEQIDTLSKYYQDKTHNSFDNAMDHLYYGAHMFIKNSVVSYIKENPDTFFQLMCNYEKEGIKSKETHMLKINIDLNKVDKKDRTALKSILEDVYEQVNFIEWCDSPQPINIDNKIYGDFKIEGPKLKNYSINLVNHANMSNIKARSIKDAIEQVSTSDHNIVLEVFEDGKLVFSYKKPILDLLVNANLL